MTAALFDIVILAIGGVGESLNVHYDSSDTGTIGGWIVVSSVLFTCLLKFFLYVRDYWRSIEDTEPDAVHEMDLEVVVDAPDSADEDEYWYGTGKKVN